MAPWCQGHRTVAPGPSSSANLQGLDVFTTALVPVASDDEGSPPPPPRAHPTSAPYSRVPPHGETLTSPQKRPRRRRFLLLRTRARPALLHLFAFVCSGVGVRGPGAAMSEADNYAYKKTDNICDDMCGEVSHSAPLPHPHSLAGPCQICPARCRGAFLIAPYCLVAADA
jgi:hypothetical protein